VSHTDRYFQTVPAAAIGVKLVFVRPAVSAANGLAHPRRLSVPPARILAQGGLCSTVLPHAEVRRGRRGVQSTPISAAAAWEV